ncbi:MAG: hypothetical protein HYR97_03225 [Candidatus Melainabacteria bacterium]|nr:hypothetical protein [Candidatus Melainabacteria bacterium]
MRVLEPKISSLESSPRLGHRAARAVFVRKHDLLENTEAVQTTTGNITQADACRWLFLVEGYRNYRCQENLYLEDLTGRLGVQTSDPIQNPFTESNAQAAMIDPYDAALSIFVIDCLDLLNINQVKEIDCKVLEHLIDSRLESVSKMFEINSQRLKREFDKLAWDDQEKLSRQILALSEVRKKLIAKSNDLGKVRLNEVFSVSHQPYVFVMSGIEHELVFVE